MENAVTRLFDPLQGNDWVSNHWDQFVSIHAEDVVVEARSASGQRYEARGRDAVTIEARSLSDVGLRHLSMEPLEVRGDRVALIRWVNWRDEGDDGAGPASVEQVVVVETDTAGKVARVVIFDPELIELARAELEERARDLSRPRP